MSAEAKAEEKTKVDDLPATIEKLQKKFGKGCVDVASRSKALAAWRRIETGVFGLDYVTGGGIPHGAATLFYGVESGGKSVTVLKTIAAAQRMCREHVVKMVPVHVCPDCGAEALEPGVCQEKKHPKGTPEPRIMVKFNRCDGCGLPSHGAGRAR